MFSLEGQLGFDALFHFTPFQFIIDSTGYLKLKAGDEQLSIYVGMTLSGPSPWHALGKATIEVLGFKQSISFDNTPRFGSAAFPGVSSPRSRAATTSVSVMICPATTAMTRSSVSVAAAGLQKTNINKQPRKHEIAKPTFFRAFACQAEAR
jgi:hypothetical protein